MPTRAQSYGKGLSPLELLLLLTSIWQLKKNYLFGFLVTKKARATAHLLQNTLLHLTHQHCPEGPSMATPWGLLHPLPLLLWPSPSLAWHPSSPGPYHLFLHLLPSLHVPVTWLFSFPKKMRCCSLCQAGSPHTFFPEQSLTHSLGLSSSAESFPAEIRYQKSSFNRLLQHLACFLL